ncbi:adenine phosphoribosyltransferase [Tomitella biformata]|uniref:adenine phosphoribosyltransferase n=1 Tax=Tomitella biformata TaxID=630403 RepID=UPI0004648BFE|nr:adenine phosphoribosyltransferase [Tomitella biformata]
MGGTVTTSPHESPAAGHIRRLTRHVQDFPDAGVIFADLTPVFADGPALRSVIQALAESFHGQVDMVAGIDARGFLLGSGVALELQTGVLAVRKKGKLPPPVHSQDYALEYGESTLEIPADAIEMRGRRVLVVDDVLATGGTVLATVKLLRRCGAEVMGVAVVLEVQGLGGRAALKGENLVVLASD